MIGDGPVGLLDVKAYRERLSWLNKKALTDDNFIEELVYANLSSPHAAKNGILLLDRKHKETEWMLRKISERSNAESQVLLVVLDPSGRDLLHRRM